VAVAPDRALVEERIRRGFESWNRGDFAAFLEDVHPDIEYAPGIVVSRAEGEPVIYRGRDELFRFFDEWHSQWRMEIAVGEIEEIGEWFVVLGRAKLTGVQSGAAFEQDVGWIGQADGEARLLRLYSYPSHEAAREAAAAMRSP
jgi:ketosteroid isomerase-like protein